MSSERCLCSTEVRRLKGMASLGSQVNRSLQTVPLSMKRLLSPGPRVQASETKARERHLGPQVYQQSREDVQEGGACQKSVDNKVGK